MRFERLELERFGHFEQLALDLPKKPGLVVIHGPNEAGKTTLLRAIHGLLFGIEERTPYGFRFDYRSLSVRADLRDAAGRLLTVRRRKRRKQSLLATVDDGETIRALDEEAFAAYLGGVDEALYRALFGFTQFDLQRGSEVLQTLGLAEVIGGGALGGSGERIREALSWLTEEAEALFKLRGKLPAINRTLDALRDARSELAEATLQQRGYLELTEGLARTRAEIEDVDAGLVARRRRRARIVALLAGFEDFHEARELDERLARAAREQPESVALAVDDAARIEAILGELALRRPQLAALEEDDARTTARLAQLADDPAILAEEAAVERLARRSERIAGLRRELPRARGELSRRRDTLAARAVELGAAAAPEQAALAELGARLDRWRAEVEAAASVTRERAAAQASLEVAQAALAAEAAPAGEDLTPLASELDGALAAQRELEALTRSQARLDAKIDVARARLDPPLPADVDLVRASPPSLATIREAHEADQELARRERAAVAAQAEAQAQRAAAQAELAVLIAAGGVPDPEALATLRARRDAKLTALVDAWERGEPFARVDLFHQGRGLELVTAAREAIERADLHADRMRDAAERIAKRVELERQVARHEAALREREVEATAIATARGAWDESWRALWARCSVAPRRPARMLEWCEELAALQRDVHERAQLAREGEELAARLREFTSRLRAALDRDEKHVSRDMLSDAARDRGAAMDPASRRRADADLAADAGFVDDPRGAEADDAPSPALTELAPRLRARISREHARQGRETSLRDQVARQEVAVTRARAAAGEAATRVADAAAQLRSRARALLPKLSHEEDSWRDLEAAAATLERLRALEELARERALVDREEARVREALADVEGFERELQATRARLGDAQPVDDPEVAVEQLARRLARAKSSATARAHARDQAEEGRRAQARARQAIAALEEELARRTAALPSSARAEGTLARVAQAAQERGRLIRRRDELERHLVRSLGAGDERAALERELATAHRESLAAEQGQLVSEIAALEARRNALAEQKGKLEREHEQLGGDRAVRLNAQKEALLADLSEQVDRHALLSLAHSVLARVTERHAQESQSTVLAQTSELLRRISGGRHVEVAADPQADTIAVIGADGLRRHPDQLSTGAREQVFLALRMAYVLEYADASEALPVIMDDALVNFDDARAGHTLRALGELSGRVQILFLTCHRHLVELARRELDDPQILELPGPDAWSPGAPQVTQARRAQGQKTAPRALESRTP